MVVVVVVVTIIAMETGKEAGGRIQGMVNLGSTTQALSKGLHPIQWLFIIH